MEQLKDLLPKRVPEDENLEPEACAAMIGNNNYVATNGMSKLVKTILPTFNGGRILDIGCGNASVSIELGITWPGSKVVGVDSCPMMFGAARALYNRMKADQILNLRNTRLPEGDIGFNDQSFDLVFSRSTLHHFQDPMEYWSSVKKYVKENGAIFTYDLCRPMSSAEAWQWVGRNTDPERTPEALTQEYFRSFLSAFRPQEVLSQLNKIGLNSMRISKITPVHMVIWRAPK